MSGCKKTLFRYSDGIRVTSAVRPHSTELKEKVPDGVRGAWQAENASKSRRALSTGCAMNEVTKGLNIPFDEVVYQDLISLNDTRRKIKCDQLSKFDGRPRKPRKLDPTPELSNVLKPNKVEFLFCDLLGKKFDLERAESGYSSLTTQRCNVVAGALSESRKISAMVKLDKANIDADAYNIRKLKLLHKNYGLAPPKPKAYFAGSSLFERSQAWKISGKSQLFNKNSGLFYD